MIWLFLLGSLVVILIAAEVFTNALEHLGQRLKISEGVTGSLFAAVGTAMPETIRAFVEAGIHGVCLKDCSEDEIVEVVRQVCVGKTAIGASARSRDD